MRAPAKNSFDITMLANEVFGCFHIIPNSGEPFEIGFNILARFFSRYGQLIGETKSRNAVNNAEINRFRAAAYFRWHPLNRHTEHLVCGHRVENESKGICLF